MLNTTIYKGKMLVDESMSNHTSFKIGGRCDFMYIAADTDELCAVIKNAKDENIPVTVMGNGTNLLVSDEGIGGIVIKIAEKFADAQVCGDKIISQSGILLSTLAGIAQKNALTGLECAGGIPGTLGGAVYMNAGAYGFEMKNVVSNVWYLDDVLNIKQIAGEECGFRYRTSFFSGKDYIILKAELTLEKGDKNQILDKMKEINARRREKQPLNCPSAGSVFKRPEGDFAGKLIQEAGLAGFSIGGAQVSEKHCGFIINTGGATCGDVLNLIEYIKEKVYKNSGVRLETEIRYIGNR